ncbi:hypothetical protein MKEN_00013100 [Mycena kentingensis (nom. inval.)]|nr:hypothetical protein MKEN_00013100 [Mycena kentingensis (nom. inval.)]
MASLLNVFCCSCFWARDAEDDALVIPNETTSLLPSNGTTMGYSTPSLIPGAAADDFDDDSELMARLGSIVRTKESKMVRIGNRAAFTLQRADTVSSPSTVTPSTPTGAPAMISPDLPLPPPPSPVAALPSIAIRHSHIHATNKSLPKRLPIPPVFTLAPAPQGWDSRFTTPAVSRSSSLSGSRLLGGGASAGRRGSYFVEGNVNGDKEKHKGRRRRGRTGRASSGDDGPGSLKQRSSSSSTTSSSTTTSRSPSRSRSRSASASASASASDLSDASGLTYRQSSILHTVMDAAKPTPKFPMATASSPTKDGDSSIVFSWGDSVLNGELR